MLALDVLSDPICPWCWLGARRLLRALEARPAHPFALAWHPFMLNPAMPPEGMDRRAYLEAKFGGRDGALRAYAPVVDAFEADGIDADLGAIARTPATLDAHRLLHWAGIEGRQTPVAMALFEAYFRHGHDIGDRAVLVDVAVRAGMDGAVTERLLSGDADAAELRARDAHARERGVTSVPTFVIAKQAVVVGAQPVETWARIVDELAEGAAP